MKIKTEHWTEYVCAGTHFDPDAWLPHVSKEKSQQRIIDLRGGARTRFDLFAPPFQLGTDWNQGDGSYLFE